MNDTSILNKKLNIVKNKVLCNKFIFHKSMNGVSYIFHTHKGPFVVILKCASAWLFPVMHW